MKCLQCDNVDLCYACYMKRSTSSFLFHIDIEVNEHMADHRVLIIPEFIDEDAFPSEQVLSDCTEYNERAETDVDDISLDGVSSQLDSVTPLSEVPQLISSERHDLREEVSTLTDSLCLELLGRTPC